jgi:hypothetical protein
MRHIYRCAPALAFSLAFAMAVRAQSGDNPYRCEGAAHDLSRNRPLADIRAAAEQLSKSMGAVDLCTAAELYKRLGDAKARSLYEQAIDADNRAKQAIKNEPEPAYELFYGDYLRLYRGAGQRPLFPQAEEHLLKARSKLKVLGQGHESAWPECSANAWNKCTADRLQRSLTALYERDGVHLASRKTVIGQSEVEHPWLFFSPGVRLARSTDDFDQTSDIRDLTSAALFSQNCLLPLNNPVRRLCTSLSQDQIAAMARIVTPMEADSTLRIRYGSAPVLDVFGSARRTERGTINSGAGFFAPDAFADLKLVDFGVRIEKPFVIAGTTDVDLQFTYDHVSRQGLIEFQPKAHERVDQFQVYGSLAHYVGPDRINLSYTYVRQNINSTPYLMQRDRELMGAVIDYQLFRPLPLAGRDVNTGLGRHFETRGIDVVAGFLNDRDRYTGPYGDVITRWDYFVGVAARGFGRIDATIRPTWYSSRVSNDPTQDNSQFRLAGNVLVRILDEERTAGIPSQRFLGMPVAFVQVVVPFHWDVPRGDFKSFQSRSVGGELSAKLFTNRQIGVAVLGVVGYSRDWFPILGKDFNLGHVGVSIGF